MKIEEIDRTANYYAKKPDAPLDEISKVVKGWTPQDICWFFMMFYLYKSFESGQITSKDGKKLKEQLAEQHRKFDHALCFSQEEYKRYITNIRKTDSLRNQITKQISAKDHSFIHTLLNLVDVLTRENIYEKLYALTQSPLTDQELDQIISDYPHPERIGIEEARAAVWNFIDRLNGDEIPWDATA